MSYNGGSWPLPFSSFLNQITDTETVEQREGQLLLREDLVITPQECPVNFLAFPKGSVATYQGQPCVDQGNWITQIFQGSSDTGSDMTLILVDPEHYFIH